MKRLFVCVLAIALLLAILLCGCGKQKTLICDNCGTEVKVDADSNMEDAWAIFCKDCNEELFGDDPLLNGE